MKGGYVLPKSNHNAKETMWWCSFMHKYDRGSSWTTQAQGKMFQDEPKIKVAKFWFSCLFMLHNFIIQRVKQIVPIWMLFG